MASRGTDTTPGCSALSRSTRHRLPQLLVHRVAARSEAAGQRLTTGIRVLDVGCRAGRARRGAVFLRRGIPQLDLRRHRLPRGVDPGLPCGSRGGECQRGRVYFEVSDATSYDGAYDLVLFFDAVHDFGDPVGGPCPRPSGASLRWPGRRGRAVPRGHPRGESRQSDQLGLLHQPARGGIMPHSMLREGGAALARAASPGRLASLPPLERWIHVSTSVAVATATNLVIEAPIVTGSSEPHVHTASSQRGGRGAPVWTPSLGGPRHSGDMSASRRGKTALARAARCRASRPCLPLPELDVLWRRVKDLPRNSWGGER